MQSDSHAAKLNPTTVSTGCPVSSMPWTGQWDNTEDMALTEHPRGTACLTLPINTLLLNSLAPALGRIYSAVPHYRTAERAGTRIPAWGKDDKSEHLLTAKPGFLSSGICSMPRLRNCTDNAVIQLSVGILAGKIFWVTFWLQYYNKIIYKFTFNKKTTGIDLGSSSETNKLLHIRTAKMSSVKWLIFSEGKYSESLFKISSIPPYNLSLDCKVLCWVSAFE